LVEDLINSSGKNLLGVILRSHKERKISSVTERRREKDQEGDTLESA